MIEEYTLKSLLIKYGINYSNLVSKNNNILEYGEYFQIDNTLKYLTKDLKISPINIEKCPSILYFNVGAIKTNIHFLMSKKVSFSSVESCLHVLSTIPNSLEDTYYHVVKNYGVAAINEITSILGIDVDRIKDIEKLDFSRSNEFDNLSIAVGRNTIDEIKEIVQSKEYQEHPEMFSSTVLANAKLEEIQNIMQSKEYQEHPEMFTSQTLAYAKLKEIQNIMQSKEYQEHPEMFTSTVLAHAELKEIQNIMQSKEYQEHPEMFTSTVLAQAKLTDIRDIMQSKEYHEHPEMFTSQTLANAKLEDIQSLLSLSVWQEEKYAKLLTSSVLAKSKKMIEKVPCLIHMAEKYGIDNFINTTFLLASPSQNYALINYLLDIEMPLITDDKLNIVFGKAPGVLKKKYDIDLKELMKIYPYSEDKLKEGMKGGKGRK